MKIKLIAVDMDGTFLNERMDYDRERFRQLYAKMQEEGIRFVVASGNQYYQLKSFFGDIQDELSYVAENGAFVVENGTELFSVKISEEHVKTITEEIIKHPQLSVVVCGKESAYVLDTVPDDFFKIINLYYHRLKRVQSFDVIDDQVLKFALSCPRNETDELVEVLSGKVGKLVTPVSSGHGSIDLIVPGFHKASGIQLLQEKWKIKDEETMALGDGGNDIEMLKHVKFGFAMENGSEQVKRIANFMAPSNNDSGVLEIIEQYFTKNGPFKDIVG